VVGLIEDKAFVFRWCTRKVKHWLGWGLGRGKDVVLTMFVTRPWDSAPSADDPSLLSFIPAPLSDVSCHIISSVALFIKFEIPFFWVYPDLKGFHWRS
jgi:hypothetical protein